MSGAINHVTGSVFRLRGGFTFVLLKVGREDARMYFPPTFPVGVPAQTTAYAQSFPTFWEFLLFEVVLNSQIARSCETLSRFQVYGLMTSIVRGAELNHVEFKVNGRKSIGRDCWRSENLSGCADQFRHRRTRFVRAAVLPLFRTLQPAGDSAAFEEWRR